MQPKSSLLIALGWRVMDFFCCKFMIHYRRTENIMNNSPITIIARIKAKPGMEERMRKDLLSLLTPTRAESGCIKFDLLINTNDKTTFILCENWQDRAALDAHFQQQYVKQVLQAYQETLLEPIKIMSLQKIESV